MTSSAEGGDEGSRDRTDQVGMANMEARSGESGDCCGCEGWERGSLALLVSWPVRGCDISGPAGAAGRCSDGSVGCCDMHRRHIHAVGAAGLALQVWSLRPEAMSGLMTEKRPGTIAEWFPRSLSKSRYVILSEWSSQIPMKINSRSS